MIYFKAGVVKNTQKNFGDIMSKCLWCKGPVESSFKNGKPKKYCSKKCSNEFYAERDRNKLREKLDPPTPCKACGALVERFLLSNKPKKYCSEKCAKDPQWLKRLKKNAWIDENCISKEEVAKQLGIHTGTVTNRMRKLGLKEHYKVVDGLNYSYVATIDIYPIKNVLKEKKVPDGFITREELCRNLGLSVCAFKTKLSKIQEATGQTPPEITMKSIYHKDAKLCPSTSLYNKKEITEFLYKNKEYTFNCAQCNKEFKTLYSTKKYCGKTCAKAAERARHRQRLADRYISAKECAELFGKLGITGDYPSPRRFLYNNLTKFGFSKKLNAYYIEEAQFDSFIKRFRKAYFLQQQLKELDKQITKENRHKKIVRRSAEQNAWEYQERLLYFRLAGKIERRQQKWGIDSDEFKDLITFQTKRFSYLVDYWDTGTIKKFTCKTCHKEKPFYEFHTSCKTSAKGLDIGACKECVSQKGTEKRKVDPKKYQKNGRKKFRILVATSIKNFINKKHGTYQNGLSVYRCWQALEEKCGYTCEDLMGHIESQFTSNMNWVNQYTPKKPGEYGWHMDHIIPHSSFNYDSFDHPDFAKCWALENLRPLCAIMNIQKGNKKLYQCHYSTFRDGLKKRQIYKAGIWKHLDYTNLDAKKYIESKFSDEMNWENHGQFWQLDHINPMAHLAYLDESDTNFKLAWSLSNLMPIEKSENSSKSSIFENKLWLHNYTDADYSSKICV